MKNSSQEIIGKIQILLNELAASLGGDVDVKGQKKKTSPHPVDKKYSGATGGVDMLVDQDFFAQPKSLLEVIPRLRQEGYNYPRTTVSMALLRAVRNRVLVRLPAEDSAGKEKWVYVIRK